MSMIKVKLNRAIVYNKNIIEKDEVIDIDNKFFNEYKRTNLFELYTAQNEKNIEQKDEAIEDNKIIETIKKTVKRVR